MSVGLRITTGACPRPPFQFVDCLAYFQATLHQWPLFPCRLERLRVGDISGPTASAPCLPLIAGKDLLGSGRIVFSNYLARLPHLEDYLSPDARYLFPGAFWSFPPGRPESRPFQPNLLCKDVVRNVVRN